MSDDQVRLIVKRKDGNTGLFTLKVLFWNGKSLNTKYVNSKERDLVASRYKVTHPNER